MQLTALRAIEPGDSLVRLVERFGEMYSQGRYADSAAIAADILAFLQEHRSPLDLDLAANLNNLGSLAYAQGQLDMSEPFYQGALRIYQKVLGPDNINTASVLYNLAGLYLETGRSAVLQPDRRGNRSSADDCSEVGSVFYTAKDASSSGKTGLEECVYGMPPDVRLTSSSTLFAIISSTSAVKGRGCP